MNVLMNPRTSALPQLPPVPKENRTRNFQLLLTPTEHTTLMELSTLYGLSRGAFCRLGLHGLIEQVKRDVSSPSPQGLPVTVDQFWSTFRGK